MKTSKLYRAVPILMSMNLKRTEDFYTGKLGFKLSSKYPDYLIFTCDMIELYFTFFPQLKSEDNSSACYIRVESIEELYDEFLKNNLIHPNGKLETKPWRQKEFAITDSENNLLRFGEAV